MASVGNLSATISANANPFIKEFDRADREARRKTQSIGQSIDKMQGDIRKKFSGSQLGGSILSGLGIGSGFAIAQQIADRISESYKQAAEAAKVIEEMSVRSLEHTKRMLALRNEDRTDAEKIMLAEREAQQARSRYESASADRYRAKVGFFGQSLGNEVIPKTPEEQEQIKKLLKEAQDLEYEFAKLSRSSNIKGAEEKLNDFFGSVERGAGKIGEEVNTKLRDFFYTIDNPPDIGAVEEALNQFFDSVENGAEKISQNVDTALRDFFYTIDNAPELTKWTQYQEGMLEIFTSIGERSAATFSEMVRTGENALDSLLDSVADAFLQMAFRMGVVNPLLNSVFGLSGASILPAFFGVGAGKADGGQVNSGMMYPVGERGIEMFAPSTSGTIIPNHKLGGGSARNVYNIDARGASTDAVKELRAMMSAMNASIEPRSVAAVRDADKRRK